MYTYEFEKKFNEIFSKNLRYYMDSRGVSQNELAKELNVSPTSVNNWYNGYKTPRMDKVDKICRFFHISRSALMEEHDSDHLPSNAILPSAKAVPIMGTICAGDGVVCEDDYSGNFIIDTNVTADYCLKVHGDSMQTANIYDGDLVFIKKDYDIVSGRIYAVENLDTHEASLKKVTFDNENIILIPCNPEYQAVVSDYREIRIAGECVGVFHKY